jgi:hypothetical protein
MAIIIPRETRAINWFAVGVFVFLLLVIAGGGYFLFFAPTPGIELIAPIELQSAERLSAVKLDSAAIVNDPVLKTLRQYGTPPLTQTSGRRNPFSPY